MSARDLLADAVAMALCVVAFLALLSLMPVVDGAILEWRGQ